MDSYNLDVDDYSIDELFQFINYPGKKEDATNKSIADAVKSKYKLVTETVKDKTTVQMMKLFLKQVKVKLSDSVAAAPGLSYSADDLTPKNLVPFMNTNNYQYPTGLVNPIEKRTMTKVISIDSVFRENAGSSTTSDFVWKMPGTQQNVISMKLISLELPLVWYVVSEKYGTNVMKIGIYNLEGQTDQVYTIKIPSGSYNSDDFAQTFNTIISNMGGGLENIICEVNGSSFKTILRVDTLPGTGTTVYDSTHPNYSPDFYFTVDFDEYSTRTTLGSFLGFTSTSYSVNSTDTNEQNTYKGYLECETAYGNGRSNYLFISIEDFNKNCISNPIIASSTQYLGDSVIGRIPITESFGSVMPSNASDKIFKQREYLGPVNIDKFHIKLLDKFNNVIDLNNNDISLALELTEIYSNNKTYTRV